LTKFLKEESAASGEITFYDTVTGKPLFVAPKGRSWASFVKESKAHGWPSFRDAEVVTDNVRVRSIFLQQHFEFLIVFQFEVSCL
jgi:hypothetical protein